MFVICHKMLGHRKVWFSMQVSCNAAVFNVSVLAYDLDHARSEAVKELKRQKIKTGQIFSVTEKND